MYDSKVHDFVEGHNHRMVADSDMQFVHSARKLTHVQEEDIYGLSNVNLGPVKVFNLMRTEYGGFEKVGAIKDDCKNFKQVNSCVLANEISKSNYLAFGDIISFDAAFKTNKYKMVFVPFTAIDNHCHSVTVGAGLLTSETIESYTWLLQMLLKSFVSAPKVGADLCNNEDFKSRLCNIVWTDSISPFEFEEKWQAIMVEFDWIPAFYRDEPLSGLMRTTSRSESKNHFLRLATNSELTIVEFFNHFDFCMEIQRYNGRRCDHDSRYMYPQLETSSYLEREAVRIYTRSIFNDVHDEMNEIIGGVSQLGSSEEK
ncbi:protein FAR1-RELATED SEQUENCE 5-like [Bidens hawaiensis]|uniref:protein FAR1-RELATED SEQUENCE 5-like n=1 Tax=Bidens hawaiensis TaxID=980011 RepID=UPI004049D6C1